jgi:hypothetical protein
MHMAKPPYCTTALAEPSTVATWGETIETKGCSVLRQILPCLASKGQPYLVAGAKPDRLSHGSMVFPWQHKPQDKLAS